MANQVCRGCIHYDVCLLHEDNFIADVGRNGFCGKFRALANLREVQRGAWVPCKNNSGYKCSECGARIKNSDFFNGNHLWCHKCGAKMDKKNV